MACSLIWPGSAHAVDCARKPTELDTVICDNAELRQVDDAITKLIAALYTRLSTNNGREFATIVADQLRWREALWRQCVPLSAACLLPKYRARHDYLKPHPEVVASELYLQSGIKIRGETLELRFGKKPGVYLREQQIAGPTARIDVAERYTDASVDALVFVANRGGNGADCSQFPVYIVAVRPDVEPEIVDMPSILGTGTGQQMCIDRISRVPGGFMFEIGAWPWADGKTYVWKAVGGLYLVDTSHFAPRAGTRMHDLIVAANTNSRLENEQFFNALRTATTALDLNFADATSAFWFSWSEPYRRGDYVVLESCAKPGRKDECTGEFVGKAVYEQRTDRIFFAFSTAAAPPDCKLADGRDPIDAALRGLQFFPPRFKWSPGALEALKERYCPRLR